MLSSSAVRVVLNADWTSRHRGSPTVGGRWVHKLEFYRDNTYFILERKDNLGSSIGNSHVSRQ